MPALFCEASLAAAAVAGQEVPKQSHVANIIYCRWNNNLIVTKPSTLLQFTDCLQLSTMEPLNFVT